MAQPPPGEEEEEDLEEEEEDLEEEGGDLEDLEEEEEGCRGFARSLAQALRSRGRTAARQKLYRRRPGRSPRSRAGPKGAGGVQNA